MSNDQPIRDVSYISKINKISVLNLVRERHRISRSEIAKEIGLSLPTVSRLVDSLVHHERLIREIGPQLTRRGRPPSLLEFAGNENFVIGLSIGKVHISGVLANLDAHTIAQLSIPTGADKGFGHIVHRAAGLINRLIRTASVRPESVLGIGIAIGGLIDTRRNRIAYSATLNWVDRDLAGALGSLVRKPIKVDHDARVMALGELWFGIGDRVRNFICVLIGYGIGAAFIVDGKPFFGKCGMTGELGHIVVAANHRARCTCGNRGCLDALASGRAIALQARKIIERSSILKELSRGDPECISAQTVALAAQRGDPFARRILLRAATYIGTGLAALINLYNPEAVVLGGGLVKAGDFFLDRISKVARDRTLGRISQGLIIQPSVLADRSRVMGAVALILNEILHLNIPGYAGQIIPIPPPSEAPQAV